MSERRNWTHDLKQLQDIAREEILPAWREDVTRPDRSWPTIEWLTDNGYAHLRWILEEKHDMSVPCFFSIVVGLEDDDGYWNIDHLKTIQEAEQFLDSKSTDRQWRGSTSGTIRSLLNRVFAEYEALVGNGRILSHANDPERTTETYEDFEEVIRRIREEATTDNSAYKYLRAVQRFFNYLDRRDKIEHNPTAELQEEFNFDLDAEGTTPLTPQQVGQLWDEAETLQEYMLIIGYVIWGVRTRELPAIHKSQFIFDGEKVEIEFEETDRKNGAGTVTVLFGTNYLLELLRNNASKSTWGGHLLPSPKNHRKPMDPETARDRFKDLCRRANIVVEEEIPTPKNGRATWMDLQARAGAMHAEIMMERIEHQGSRDPEAAIDYTSEETQEQMRQLLFLQELKPILPEEAIETDWIFLRDLKQQHELSDFE